MKKHHIKNLRQLSTEINIPYTTLWDYYSNPLRLEKANLSYIKKVAQRLKCSVDYLVYNELTEPSQAKIDGFDMTILNESIQSQNEQKQTVKFGDVEVTISKNGKITDKDILEANQFLMQEKILSDEKKDN